MTVAAARTRPDRHTRRIPALADVWPDWTSDVGRAAERALFVRAGAGDEDALDKLLEHFDPLLRSFAARIGTIAGVVDLEDLLAVARAEIALRLPTLDLETVGNPMGYLGTRVRGAMVDHLRRNDPRPRSVLRRQRQLRRVQLELEQATGRQASLADAAAQLGVDDAELAYCSRAIGEVSVESFVPAGDGRVWERADASDFESDLARRDLAVQLVAQLPDRERYVIGEVVVKERPLAEVGAEMGVSESRVCQLKTRAIARMREWHRLTTIA